MGSSVFLKVNAVIICGVLLILMPLTVQMGNKIRKRYWGSADADTKGGINSLMGALFGLWGFMLAFSFGQSGVRFENLRSMIVEESNVLRNAILRTDFFPDSICRSYKAEFSKLLEERIAYYDNAGDASKLQKNKDEISKIYSRLWSVTVALSARPETHSAAEDLAGSLMNLFDIGAKREALLETGIPSPVSFVLIVLVLAVCFFGGFTTPSIQKKEWIVIFAFSFLAAMIIYITIDLARPMEGIIRPDAGEARMLELRKLL